MSSHNLDQPARSVHLAQRWHERAHVYQQLVQDTRNIGGLIGGGGPAAAEAANAVSRIRHVRADENFNAETLGHLGRLFTRTDARLTVIIEQGAAERLYLRSAKVPTILAQTCLGVGEARIAYHPVTEPVEARLLRVVRQELRSVVPSPTVTPGVHLGREEFRDAIKQQPSCKQGPQFR